MTVVPPVGLQTSNNDGGATCQATDIKQLVCQLFQNYVMPLPPGKIKFHNLVDADTSGLWDGLQPECSMGVSTVDNDVARSTHGCIC